MKDMLKRLLAAGWACSVLLALQAPAAAVVPIENDKQYEGQIMFFKEALDEFGATNPDQVVRLWAKGDETRNGVYKYAVSGPQQKKLLLDWWGPPDKNFWIIGVSSPWLVKYEVESRVVVSPSELKYTVKYYWKTSAGPMTPTVEQLYVTETKGIWSVLKVVPLGSYQNY